MRARIAQRWGTMGTDYDKIAARLADENEVSISMIADMCLELVKLLPAVAGWIADQPPEVRADFRKQLESYADGIDPSLRSDIGIEFDGEPLGEHAAKVVMVSLASLGVIGEMIGSTATRDVSRVGFALLWRASA